MSTFCSPTGVAKELVLPQTNVFPDQVQALCIYRLVTVEVGSGGLEGALAYFDTLGIRNDVDDRFGLLCSQRGGYQQACEYD